MTCEEDVYIRLTASNLCFHPASHGAGSKTYLLPADGGRDLLDETSILQDDLIDSAKGAKTITMFLDTCYSGGTRTNEILLADARPIAIVPDKSALPPNVTLLAAASGAQLSSTYETAQQGLFSYWLMKGLEGDADANKDKKITVGELHEYVVKQIGPMAAIATFGTEIDDPISGLDDIKIVFDHNHGITMIPQPVQYL